MQQAKATMLLIGRELVQKSKAAVIAGAGEKGSVERGDMQGRDLLSLLIRANMATDLPESQRLSDEDVFARTLIAPFVGGGIDYERWLFTEVPTFLVAGHETTR